MVNAFVVLLFAVLMVPPMMMQPSCQPLETLTVCQRCYQQLRSERFGGRVYFYAPDIKTSWFGNYDPFNLWVVEGIYGNPFLKGSGSLDEQRFEQIRKSQNVTATPIKVDQRAPGKRASLTVSKRPLSIEIVKVNTSLSGTDTVTLRVCQ
jgi:hypothetical protein